MGVMQADSIARLPNDTTRNKLGVAVVNNNLFIGDGSKWIGIGGSTSGIDSVTFNSSQWVDTVKYWSGGSAQIRVDGTVSGNGGFSIGGGSFRFAGANTYAGTNTVNSGALVTVTNEQGLGSTAGDTNILSGGTVRFDFAGASTVA
jgi:autotransporter-associated beta strand protein